MNILSFNINKWLIVTDQTKRNGTSRFSVTQKNKTSLLLSAKLVPICGEINSLVGFAGAELSLSSQITYKEKLIFELDLESSQNFILTLTLVTDKQERFQYDLSINPKSTKYKVKISQFKRTFRGRVLSGKLENGDHLAKFGFSVLYSRQNTDGKNFEASLEVQKVNLL